MADRRARRRQDPKDALEPIVTDGSSLASSSSSAHHLEAVSRTILAPFRRKGDSSKILSDLAPVLMTPKLISHAASGSSRSGANALSSTSNRRNLDFLTIGRTPMRIGLNTRRITSTDLQVAEATDALLAADVPEPAGVAKDVSLLRGFQATIPSATRGKTRRRQTRNVDTPKMGLRRLGASSRGLLTEVGEQNEHEHEHESEDDVVVVKRRGRRTRESLGASVALGKEELRRQEAEILIDKENLHVRRTLTLNEVAEITHKIDALAALRSQLEETLLKLKEEELELDDELEGVRERVEFETSSKTTRRHGHVEHSSRRRKGPAFLPSEHDDLPPGVAFLTLPCGAPISSLDFSEPYGTLISSTLGNNVNEDGGDCAPRVWDMLSVAEVGRLRGHRGPVRALQVEDHVCLTGGSDGAVRVWDLRRVGADGNTAESAGVDTTDAVSDAGTDAELVTHSDAGSSSSAYAGSEIGSGEEGSDGPCARVLAGHSRAVTALYFEDNCLVTGAADKTLRQWDLATGQCVLSMDLLWAIANPPAWSDVDAAASYGYAANTDANANANVNGIPTSGASLLSSVGLGEFGIPLPPRADGSWDVYDGFVGGVQFWGHALVSGSGDGVVRMWDMRTGQVHRTLMGHTGPVTCLQFDELHIMSGSLDKTIRIWDIRTGAPETISFDHAVTALQFDSRKILAAAGENGIKVYNRTTKHLSTLSTNGHTRPAERLRFMDRYLATGGLDETVKIWAL